MAATMIEGLEVACAIDGGTEGIMDRLWVTDRVGHVA